MALALLKFPDAPAAFRRGLVHTLEEEQRHTQWYLARMADYHVHFGDLPVNGFFWSAVAGMNSPLDYVTRLPLTFEQANLDFSLFYRDIFRRAGDEATARLFEAIHTDEIGHVGYGLRWFRKWKDRGEDDWTAFSKRLIFPLSPVRAKGRSALDRAGRRAAGLDDDFIRHLDVFSSSRGRTPSVFWFNPAAETIVAGRAPDRSTQALERDLDLLPVFLARHEDVVLVRSPPRREHLEKLRHAGVELPELEVLDPDLRLRAGSPLLERKLGGLRPWAWSPDSESVLGCLRSRVGGDAAKHGWSESMRPLFSKRCGAEILAALGDPHPGTPVATIAALHAAIAALERRGHARGVVKPAFGSSGRGFRRTELWTPADDAWAAQTLLDHGELIIEPWLDRVADFSVQAEAGADGSITLKGFTGLQTDARGRFLGCVATGRFGSLFPSEVARFLHGDGRGSWLSDYYRGTIFPELSRRFRSAGFAGAFGLDALVHRTAEGTLGLRPVVELNPRCTMGRVAWELRRLAIPSARIHFSLATRVTARTAGCASLLEYARQIERQDPLICDASNARRSLAQGTLVLNDASQAQRFLAVLEVKRPAQRPQT